MSTSLGRYTVLFPEEFDARGEYESPFRGYLAGLIVQLEDGSRFSMFFVDPVRLRQELDDEVRAGHPYFTEPNMVVLPEVTGQAVKDAVEHLFNEGFFKRLKPL